MYKLTASYSTFHEKKRRWWRLRSEYLLTPGVMAKGVLITARQIIWLYKPIYQASWEIWVDDKPANDGYRSNIYTWCKYRKEKCRLKVGVLQMFYCQKSSELWSSQLWTQFKQLRIEAWKSQDFNGVEPATSRYRCNALTNWAMKPLTLGAGHLWVLMSPCRMDVKWYMECFIYWTADFKIN